MTGTLSAIWWFLLTIGILVTFHEFGHFWVARRFGVKVLRFSIGFGKVLKSWHGKDDCEYCLSLLPLGGYVKMLDRRDCPMEGEDHSKEYMGKPIWQRALILLAGPGFNVIFAIVAFWAVLVIGRPDFQPYIGTPTGLAAAAGFQQGDRIDSIDGYRVTNWTDISTQLGIGEMDRSPLSFVIDRGQKQVDLTLPLQKLKAANQTDAIIDIGLIPKQIQAATRPVVTQVKPHSGAAAAGVEAGDLILSVNGKATPTWGTMVSEINKSAGTQSVEHLQLRRHGLVKVLNVTTSILATVNGHPSYGLGIMHKSSDPIYDTVVRKGPLEAIPAAFSETWAITALTGRSISAIIHHAKTAGKGLSGPVGIAEMAKDTAGMGAAWFIYFLGIVSLSLGIMNLLPIPVLDGGQLVFLTIEAIRGKTVKPQTLVGWQMVGMGALLLLMTYALYNDFINYILS